MRWNPEYVAEEIQAEIDGIGTAVRASNLDRTGKVKGGISRMNGLTETTNFVIPNCLPLQRTHNLKHLKINDVLLTILVQCVIHFGPEGADKVQVIDLANNDISGRLDWTVLTKFKNLKKLNLDGNYLSIKSLNSHIVKY